MSTREVRTDVADEMRETAARLQNGAQALLPLTVAERQSILSSVQRLLPDEEANLAVEKLDLFLQEFAHLSHKDWAVTARGADLLAPLLLPNGIGTSSRKLLQRILNEGNWDGAQADAQARPEVDRPWAVLVSGVNGIRKTTSMYQPWFSQLLEEAIDPPQGGDLSHAGLPNGRNAFFRQLDHIVATVANNDFENMYRLTREQSSSNSYVDRDTIALYSDLKAGIFARYRMLSELLGVVLVREAQNRGLSWMCETSGKDVAMFKYINHFAPAHYRKLALHFTVNDLSFAQTSVDTRMRGEISQGIKAASSGDVASIIGANAGGPYGSEVLPGVKAASDSVWENIVGGDGAEVAEGWFKATISICAQQDRPWTARAVLPDGTYGTEFQFLAPNT